MVFGLWRCATNGDAIATSEVLAMVVLQGEHRVEAIQSSNRGFLIDREHLLEPIAPFI